MTQYQQRIDRYGPGGLIGTDTVNFELTGEAEQAYLSSPRLQAAYQTLRQWSVDAATNHANWPTKTNAQKDATHRETIRRLGVLMDRLADLLLLEGRT
jgi:hypothetical protein